MTTSIKEILDTHSRRLFETHTPKAANPSLGEWNQKIEEDIISNHNLLHPLHKLEEEVGGRQVGNKEGR